MKKSKGKISAVLIGVLAIAIAMPYIYQKYEAYQELEQRIANKKEKKKSKFSFGDGALSIGNSNKQNYAQWTTSRLANPDIGKIPVGMRAKELAFAETLPKDTENAFAADWTQMGPINVGGRTRAAQLDVADENTMVVGGVSGGVWKTTNNGSSWEKMTEPNDLHNVTCIVQDTRAGKTDTWYYGTGEGFGNSAGADGAFYFGNGLYRSTDNGDSWTSVVATASDTPTIFDENWDVVWNIALDTSHEGDEDIIYAATYGTIYKSIDSGENWTQELGSNASPSYATDIAVTSTGVAYATLSSDGAATQRGIWRLNDDDTWVNILPEDFPPVYDRIVMGINPSDENEIYFLAQTPEYGLQTDVFFDGIEWNSLWRYNYVEGDGAGENGSWTNLSENIPNEGTPFDKYNAQGGYNMVVAVKPDEPNTVFIGGTNLYRSTDGFTSTENTTQIGGYFKGSVLANWDIYENQHPDQHRLLFKPSNPDILVCANDGGMYISQDCTAEEVSWTSLNNGYYTTQLHAVGINQHNNTNTIIGGFQDNGNFVTKSSNPNDSWVMPYNGDGAESYTTADESLYYLSIQNGKVAKMTLDDVGNRTGFQRIDPEGGEDALFINPFVVDPNDEKIMYYPEGGRLWRNNDLSAISLDGGIDPISTGWSQFSDQINGSSISAIAVSESNPPHRVYIGTSTKRVFRIDNANTGDPDFVEVNYTDADGGAVGISTAYVSCIAIHPDDADKIMMVRSNYSKYSLFYSEDAGNSWEKASGNLEEFNSGNGNGPSTRWLSMLPLEDGSTIFFVATSTGLYATNSINGTETFWQQVGSNTIGSVVVQQVRTRASDGLVVVATHGNGIYTTRVNSAEDVLSAEQIETSINDAVNIFPNPANELLTVKLFTPEVEDIRLSIFNAAGKIVYQETKYAKDGSQQITMPISQLSNGIYFLKIQTKEGVVSKKFVIQH